MSIDLDGCAERELVVIAPAGDLDLFTCPDASRQLQAGMDRAGCHLLIVDLSRVTFVCAIALTVLLNLRSLATQRDVELRLVVNTRPVAHLLQITGLLTEFAVYDCVAAALLAPTRAHRGVPAHMS